MIKWLIESEIFENNAKLLLDTLKKFGVEHQVWPFGRLYEDFDGCKDTIFYGSFQFADIAKDRCTVFCNLPKLDCLYYYPRFGNYLLNANYIMLPFGEIKRRKEWIVSNFGNEVFIRPSSGGKSFTGKVIKDWDKDLRFIRADPETLVIIAKPVDIAYEWRTVVVEGKVIASSQYKTFGRVVQRETVPEALQYAQDVLNTVKYSPDPIWTLDICLTNNEFKVLEVGSFSCAGLYACDPEPIIHAVNYIMENHS